MSAAAHRSLARLPVDIFDGLQAPPPPSPGEASETTTTAEQLRREIVATLKATKIAAAMRRPADHRPPPQNQQSTNPNALPPPYESITTVGALLRLSPTVLLRALDPLLTIAECRELYRRICLHCAPKAVTALALLQKQTTTTTAPQNSDSNTNEAAAAPTAAMRNNCLPTGWKALDRYLRGGFRVGTITEVVGCAGTAKTQLALQMAVTAAATRQQGSIFVDTERKVSLRRLQEMAAVRHGIGSCRSVLANVSVHAPSNLQALQALLRDALEEEILTRNDQASTGVNSSGGVNHNNCFPVRLLVIDSIAAPARRELGSTAASQAATVLQIASCCKRLADQFQLVVFIINQVGSVMNNHSDSNNNNNNDSNNKNPQASTTRAALGTAWHHCVSTRIELEHHHATGVRQAAVVKSNLVGPSTEPMPFQVTAEGVVDPS
jgi:RecA/RadA recombinase